MTSFSGILQSFQPISLNEMDEVELMNRVDKKYVFHSSLLPTLLSEFLPYYRILEIEGKREFAYNTTYFDTETCEMYHQHSQGKLNRQKLRLRLYEITGTSYLEVKINNNKGRTIKERIKTWDPTGTVIETEDFLREQVPFDIASLKPALYTFFKRITLVSGEFKERVTLDFDIRFEVPGGKAISLPYLSIAETKNDAHSHHTPMMDAMKKYHVLPMSFSKYCVGSALLNDSFKKNPFKPQLLKIEKLKNYTLQTN